MLCFCSGGASGFLIKYKKNSNLQSSSSSWYVLELQSLREEGGWTYRVVRYRQDEGGAKVCFFWFIRTLFSAFMLMNPH